MTGSLTARDRLAGLVKMLQRNSTVAARIVVLLSIGLFCLILPLPYWLDAAQGRSLLFITRFTVFALTALVMTATLLARARWLSFVWLSLSAVSFLALLEVWNYFSGYQGRFVREIAPGGVTAYAVLGEQATPEAQRLLGNRSVLDLNSDEIVGLMMQLPPDNDYSLVEPSRRVELICTPSSIETTKSWLAAYHVGTADLLALCVATLIEAICSFRAPQKVTSDKVEHDRQAGGDIQEPDSRAMSCDDLQGPLGEEFNEALRDAFTLEQFDMILALKLGKNRQDLALGNNYPEIVFHVIDHARRYNWCNDLLTAALEANPFNPKLTALAQKVGYQFGAPDKAASTPEVHLSESPVPRRGDGGVAAVITQNPGSLE